MSILIEHEIADGEYFCPSSGNVHGADVCHIRTSDDSLHCVDCGAEVSCSINRSYSIESLSFDQRRWVRDLQKYDAAFPGAIDLLRMDEADCLVLANYLAEDDGSLDEAELAFSVNAAQAIRNLVG